MVKCLNRGVTPGESAGGGWRLEVARGKLLIDGDAELCVALCVSSVSRGG